jgi:hypothetical protein
MAISQINTNSIANNVSVTFTAGSAAAPSITSTGDTNTGIFFPAADTIAFSEGGVEAMRINSSGFVTTPYQPAFQVFRTTATTAANFVVYNSVWLNIGSFYNTGNGRFTAPVAGVYQFNWGSIGGATVGTYRLQLYRNGTEINIDGTLGAQARAECTVGGTYPSADKTAFVSLAVNDYIQIYYSSGPTALYGDSSGYTHFSGRLTG